MPRPESRRSCGRMGASSCRPCRLRLCSHCRSARSRRAVRRRSDMPLASASASAASASALAASTSAYAWAAAAGRVETLLGWKPPACTRSTCKTSHPPKIALRSSCRSLKPPKLLWCHRKRPPLLRRQHKQCGVLAVLEALAPLRVAAERGLGAGGRRPGPTGSTLARVSGAGNGRHCACCRLHRSDSLWFGRGDERTSTRTNGNRHRGGSA